MLSCTDLDPMRVIRKRLLIVLSAVLLLQCAGVIAPLVLSATGVDVAEMCTCPGGVHGATCPMHHSKETETQDNAHRCALKNAATPSHAALLAFMSGAG